MRIGAAEYNLSMATGFIFTDMNEIRSGKTRMNADCTNSAVVFRHCTNRLAVMADATHNLAYTRRVYAAALCNSVRDGPGASVVVREP